jgi:hypothetical protein
MELDIKVIKELGSHVGTKVWICDYRQPDLDKKAIRHVPPTEVFIVSNEENKTNKKIYYSDTHFRPVGKNGEASSKMIAIFDNTGYRAYPGVPLHVFDNKEECVDFYNDQADKIISAIDDKISWVVVGLNNYKNEILDNKLKSRK